MSQKIERTITIEAPAQTVWEVITKPEHISKWYSNKAELELKPGGKGQLTWDAFGAAPLEVVTVDEPNLFSFLWVSPDEETQRDDQKTLVEFRLSASGQSTTLHLTESGFDALTLTAEEKASLIKKHSGGWDAILSSLQNYAAEHAKQA